MIRNNASLSKSPQFTYLFDFLPAQYLRYKVYITRLDGLLVLFGPRGTFNVNQRQIVFIYETNAESDKYFLRVPERFVDFLVFAISSSGSSSPKRMWRHRSFSSPALSELSELAVGDDRSAMVLSGRTAMCCPQTMIQKKKSEVPFVCVESLCWKELRFFIWKIERYFDNNLLMVTSKIEVTTNRLLSK